MNIVVIVPAAGSGSRFGGQIPKQFLLLAGKPVIQHVIDRFLRDPSVSRVIVPVSRDMLASMSRSSSEDVVWVAGGETRQQSVIRALAEAGDAELIAVHDAARPLLSARVFHAVVEAARATGAALPVLPVADTIHVMNEDLTIAKTLDRSTLGAAQTPQCFRADLLREILDRAVRENIDGTDEAGLAVRFGHRVQAVPGDPRNLKITLPEDLEVAESYLRQGGTRS
jgi:2-C-methyl-D-erythritol 4-phosphate cytidylyltransferase